jgi:hypothetical protein
MTPPDPRVEVEHCPGCEDPSRYASRGCPGIESASDDTAKKNANGDILTELAALLFAERVHAGFYDGDEAVMAGTVAFGTQPTAVSVRYIAKARAALDAIGVTEALTATRRAALEEAAKECESVAYQHGYAAQRVRDDSDRADGEAQQDDIEQHEDRERVADSCASRIRAIGKEGT